MTAEWAPKALVYLGLFALAGSLVARTLVTTVLPSSHPARAALAPLSRITLLAAALACAALLLRVWFYSASSFGWSDAASWENLRLVTIESRWGSRWQWQFAAAAVCFLLATVAGLATAARLALGVAILVLCVTLPLLGHAAGSLGRQVMHAIHIATGAIWLGSLMALVSVRWGAEAGDVARRPPAAVIARFSPLALSTAAVVAASGTLATILYLAAPGNLLATPYGQWLLLKLALVALVAGCGWTNWRHVRRGAAPSLRVMQFEAGLAVMILIVTSVLTETEHP